MQGPQPLAMLHTGHVRAGTFNRNVACIADLWPSFAFLVCRSHLQEGTKATSVVVRSLRELLVLNAEFVFFNKELTDAADDHCCEGSHDDFLSEYFYTYRRPLAMAALGGTLWPQPQQEPQPQPPHQEQPQP
ncbi:uncharacterized protein LOC144099470 [Amblyomma americanum]